MRGTFRRKNFQNFSESSLLNKNKGNLHLKAYPHPWMPEFSSVYLADQNDDPFFSNVKVIRQEIVIPEDTGVKKFSINTRWFVEGFGYIFLSADNGGNYFSFNDFPKKSNLNLEFAKSRVCRNRKVKSRYQSEGAIFSYEVEHFTALSENFLEDALKENNTEKSVRYADSSLKYALIAGEKIEIERAGNLLTNRRNDKFYFGCETRQYIWAKSEDMIKAFESVFNFATITHYVWDTWYEIFEPREGVYNWGLKDNIVNWLAEKNITIQGRPLLWFHPLVTPEWLKNKNFSALKKYVEKHTQDLVSHYNDKILQWEIVNEYHDWANIHNHTPEQITEIVKLACDKTREVNPGVVRILNNTNPWGEYAAAGKSASGNSGRPLRTPAKFICDLQNAGVDYDVLGLQIYFPQRDLSDIVRLIERFEKFGKPIYITELGTTSGPTKEMIINGDMNLPDEPYEWHRHWDEELQADWLEQVYKIYYSRPSIKAVNWYDFSDFRPHIKNGGLLRENSTPKRSFKKLSNLLGSWDRLPKL